MNKVFLFGSIYNIKVHEKFVTFSISARFSEKENYIPCLITGTKVKKFIDTFNKGDKITVEGKLQISKSQKDNKYYTTVLVDSFYSDKLRWDKTFEVANKDNKTQQEYEIIDNPPF
jgi:single-stranded DNA-binding protein